MSRLPLALLLVVLGLAVGGCMHPPRSTVVRASAVVSINDPPEARLAAASSPAWARQSIRVTATVAVPEDRREESPGLALAAARLLARDQARGELRQRLARLPVAADTSLGALAAEHAGVASALGAFGDSVAVAWDSSADGQELTATIDTPLAELARAIAVAQGAPADQQPVDETARLRDRLQAEAIAQRAADEAARAELLRRLLAYETSSGATVRELLRKHPTEQETALRLLQDARTTMNERIVGERWKVILETDLAPLLLRLEFLERPAPRGR
jgi:hypothetical protein